MLCMSSFQSISGKERVGKLAGDCNFEPCLENYGRKESEVREGRSRKVICMKDRWEGNINNTGLSTFETELPKIARDDLNSLIKNVHYYWNKITNRVTISIFSVTFLLLLNKADTETAVVSFVNWSMKIQWVCLGMSLLHVWIKGTDIWKTHWLTVTRAVCGWRRLRIQYMQHCY